MRTGFVSWLVFCGVVLACSAYRHHGKSSLRRVRRQTANKRQVITCDANALYRTLDGTCNNLQNPDWGSAGSKLLRFVPNAYADGISIPRQSAVSARNVSVKCHGANKDRAEVSLMVMQWGQFLDHDLTLVHTHEIPKSEACCSGTENSECFSILFSDDEYFTNRTCFPFARSEKEENSDGSGVLEPVNSITAFIDASNVYGSSEDELLQIRGSSGRAAGLVRTVAGIDLLPEDSDALECIPDGKFYCFLGGDVRINEQPALAAMHTIFAREHNRIARRLRWENSNWTPEKVFQEARRIVAAIMQVITYEEFLPVVLSRKTRNYFRLNPGGYRYSSTVNPGIANGFATAAYRFGHSLIPDFINLSSGELLFKDVFFHSRPVFEAMDEIVERLFREDSMKVDKAFSHSVTRHLFQEEEGTGLDLVALNIQRGRDHGLPSYNRFREFCRLSPKANLAEIFPGDTVAQGAYSDPNDVDLFSGAMFEEPFRGGLVGETFACLLGQQFRALKRGDRFFYENTGENWSFTRRQLDEVRKIRLSKVICENTDNNRVPRDVFRTGGPRVRCNDLPDIDWSQFRERTGGGGGGG